MARSNMFLSPPPELISQRLVFQISIGFAQVHCLPAQSLPFPKLVRHSPPVSHSNGMHRFWVRSSTQPKQHWHVPPRFPSQNASTGHFEQPRPPPTEAIASNSTPTKHNNEARTINMIMTSLWVCYSHNQLFIQIKRTKHTNRRPKGEQIKT